MLRSPFVVGSDLIASLKASGANIWQFLCQSTSSKLCKVDVSDNFSKCSLDSACTELLYIYIYKLEHSLYRIWGYSSISFLHMPCWLLAGVDRASGC